MSEQKIQQVLAAGLFAEHVISAAELLKATRDLPLATSELQGGGGPRAAGTFTFCSGQANTAALQHCSRRGATQVSASMSVSSGEPGWLTEEVKTGVSKAPLLRGSSTPWFSRARTLVIADDHHRHRVRRRRRAGFRLPSLRGVSRCTRAPKRARAP